MLVVALLFRGRRGTPKIYCTSMLIVHYEDLFKLTFSVCGYLLERKKTFENALVIIKEFYGNFNVKNLESMLGLWNEEIRHEAIQRDVLISLEKFR